MPTPPQPPHHPNPANVQLTSAKYTVVKGSLTVEPSYNFDKKAAAVAVSKKQGKNNFKLSYDLKVCVGGGACRQG